jgi:hypothetical protein
MGSLIEPANGSAAFKLLAEDAPAPDHQMRFKNLWDHFEDLSADGAEVCPFSSTKNATVF